MAQGQTNTVYGLVMCLRIGGGYCALCWVLFEAAHIFSFPEGLGGGFFSGRRHRKAQAEAWRFSWSRCHGT